MKNALKEIKEGNRIGNKGFNEQSTTDGGWGSETTNNTE